MLGTMTAAIVLFGQQGDPLSGLPGWGTAGILGLVLAWIFYVHLPAEDRQLADKDGVFREMLEAKDNHIKDLVAARDRSAEAVAEAHAKAVREIIKNCQEESRLQRDSADRQFKDEMGMLGKINDGVREGVHATRGMSNELRLRNHLAEAVQGAETAIWTKNLEGTIISWNPACEKLLGWKSGEVVGHHVSGIVPADRMDEEAEILRKIADGQTVDTYETVRLHKSGRLVAVLVLTSPIKNLQTGRVIAASTIVKESY